MARRRSSLRQTLMGSFVLLVAGSMLALPPGGARPAPPRLERGQEFIYAINYTQESDRPGSGYSRMLLARVLILDVGPGGAQAAFMTEQRIEAKPGAEPVPVVRLEMGRIDPLGRVTLEFEGTLPRLPIDGPPTLEILPFLEMPRELPDPGRTWEIADPELTPQTWRVLLAELIPNLGRCLKLKGEQSSGDWNLAGRLVWRREEMAWRLLEEGYVARVERKTEWRTESGDVFRSQTIINLEAVPATLPPEQFKDRRFEVAEACRFARDLAELTRPRGEPDYRGYDELLRAIDRHPSRGTPYGAAIHSLRRRAELARSGERPPEPVVIHARKEPFAAADIDQPAPDLTFASLTGGRPVRLSELRGKPVMLVLFKPSSKLLGHLLNYVRAASMSYATHIHVLPLVVDAGESEAMRLRDEYKLGAVYDGTEILRQFAGRSTPRVVVIDPAGTVRLIAPGWGGEYPEWFHKEMLKLVPRK